MGNLLIKEKSTFNLNNLEILFISLFKLYLLQALNVIFIRRGPKQQLQKVKSSWLNLGRLVLLYKTFWKWICFSKDYLMVLSAMRFIYSVITVTQSLKPYWPIQ